MPYTPPSWGPPGQAPAPGPRSRRDRGLTALAVCLGLLAAAVTGVGWYDHVTGRAGPAVARETPAPPSGTPSPAPVTKPALPALKPIHVPDTRELAASRRPGEATAWIASDTTDLPRRTVPVDGPWIVGDTVVQALYREVTAYRLSDGAEVWNLTLPTPVCEVPANPTPDGRIVVVLASSGSQRGASCDRFQQIDLRTGKAGWRKELLRDPARDTPALIVHTAISGDTLAVAEGMGAAAYRVGDGARLFGIPTENPGRCHPDQVAGGTRLLVSATCALGVDRSKRYSQLRSLDPRTGAVRWRHRTPAGRKAERVISVDPVVYTSLDNETLAEDWRIVALGPRGELRRTIDPRPKGFEHCPYAGGDTDLDPCPGLFVAHGLVHVGGTARVGAYSLATGKLVWGIQSHDSRILTPVGSPSASGTLVYESATVSRPGRTFLLGRDGAGKEKVLMRHPAAAAEAEYSTLTGPVLHVGGRILAMPSHVSGEDARRQPRMVSFAPAAD